MKLSTFKQHLQILEDVTFELANWEQVPAHYHLTEIWIVSKSFIDCGGVTRSEEKISLQLRTANDLDHRLQAKKILSIIEIYEQKISSKDLDIEIEYQWETVGKYWLDWMNGTFILTPTMTDCLAKDACGIPSAPQDACCGWGCC